MRPPRNHYVFHIYADALFGDDVEAARMNPRFQNGIPPLAFHPDLSTVPADDAVADPKTSRHVGGVLCHAPYSFRTIQAAIEYACTCGPSGQGWLLGAATPGSSPVRRVTWIVIHCLPGIYSPFDSQDPADEFEPMSGMRRSGDIFPIELPYGISLQGTSALDTIIDARNSPEGLRTHAISIIEPGSAAAVPSRPYIAASPLAQNTGGQPTHPIAALARTFVDGFTIRGTSVYVDRNATITSPRYSAGAGVLIARATGFWREPEQPNDIALAPTISNCFINHCGVGVAVIALQEDPGVLFTWRPLLVNNTFADNTYVDIYNGSIPGTGPMPGTPTGVNRLRVVNNICMGPGGASPQPFAGMHDTDLHVVIPPAILVNANAYPGGAVVPNAPAGWTNEWPLPAVDPTRPTLPTPVAPNVDTAALTSDRIFINRVFVQTRGPISPHDYRLAPWSLAVFNPTQDPTGMRNPMVNAGLTIAGAGGIMQFANGLRIDAAMQTAGLPQIASDATTNVEHPTPLPVEPLQLFDAWDTDGEGFGNPRIHLRPGFPDPGLGGIDLGADELGDLVMAGYVDDTRMFTRITALMPPQVMAPVVVQPQIFFFDVQGVTASRPMANAVFGGLHWSGGITDWFKNMQTNPAPYSLASNYGFGAMELSNPATIAAIGSWRSGMLDPSRNQKVVFGNPSVTMRVLRNLACDFAPALAPDVQPLWMVFPDLATIPSGCPALISGIWPPLLSPDPRDFYGTNSWFCDNLNYQSQRQPANLSNPTSTTPACDLTILIDNPFVYYNPSSGLTPDVGFPQSAAQTPTWHSNATSGVLHPPGTTIDMNLIGSTGPIAPRLVVQAFGAFPFGPLAPCTALSTTYSVGLDGVGDVSSGCPDEVPPIYSGNGIRINCMQGVSPTTGFGTSNLQTFLVYSRVVDAPGTGATSMRQSSARAGSPESLIRPATREQMVDGLRHRFPATQASQR